MENSFRLQELREFLMDYFSIWEKEVLNYYPKSYDHFPQNWAQTIKNLSDHDKWLIDSKQSYESIKGNELFDLFNKLDQLISIPKAKKNKNLHLSLIERESLKIKKQHEIESLLQFFSAKKNELTDLPKNFLDIGGGKGHLSRLIEQKLLIEGTCLEMNQDLINSGKKLLAKNAKLQFSHQFLPPENLDSCVEIFKNFKKDKKSLCLGLHTCGPLATTILKASRQSNFETILNFGCCYLKLTPGEFVGISAIGKKFNLPLSKYALTLATRAHTGPTWEDFMMKKRVKYFRYGIHLYLYYKLGIQKFINVGDGSKNDYKKSFGEYVDSRLERLSFSKVDSIDQINKWFEKIDIQEKISDMFAMNIIRWQFGRAIELWILLDRACYLEEQGYEAKLEEFFDEKISPRNIGLYANKLS